MRALSWAIALHRVAAETCCNKNTYAKNTNEHRHSPRILGFEAGTKAGNHISRSLAGGNPTHKSFPRRRESSTYVVPAQAGIQWSASDDWVPAHAGMTDKWEAHS